MKVITSYPIYLNNKEVEGSNFYLNADGEEFHNAKGEKIKEFFKKHKGEKIKGFIGKVKSFVGKLKAKRNARKLKRLKNKEGKEGFVDVIPPLLKGADGTFKKTLPDGSTQTIPSSQVQKGADGNIYYTEDLKVSENQKAPTVMTDEAGNKFLGTEIPLEDTHTLTTTPDAGSVNEVYKKSDVIDENGTPLASTKGGMSKNLKMGLIIGGGLLLVIGIVYAVKKR